MRQRRFQFQPRLEALENRLCPSSTTILPISAFLSQQGHDHVFTPPVPDEQAWSNSTFDPGAGGNDPTRFLWADYTGQAAQYLLQHGINLHTAVSGFVTETPIGNTNLMEVTVNLEATNALTWVANIADISANATDAVNTAPLELGYRPADLVANPSLKPALSDETFQVTWQEQIGQPLPDLPRLNEGFAPPLGFAFERFNVATWGVGTLDAATTVGTPGQTAIVSTTQVADLTNPNLAGTYSDAFWQEPIDIVPVASASTHVGSLGGTLFVADTSNANDSVTVAPTGNGGVTLSSNLGGGTFAGVNRVLVYLGGGNDHVQIGNLTGTTVNVAALDGNDQVAVGAAGKILVHLGEGNNNISTGPASVAQFIAVSGGGNNQISTTGAAPCEIVVAGDGNNHVSAAGAGDFIEVVGNGNNHIADVGINDLVWLGGDGNNDIQNDGAGSVTDILAGTGHNHIH